MSDPTKTATVLVANADELWGALHSAQSGDTILLAPGVYANLNLTGLQFAGGVTVASADPMNEAIVGGLSLGGSSGLTFDHLNLVALNSGFAATLSGVSNVTFSNLSVHSDSGSDVGAGFLIRDSSNVTVTASEFSHLGSGIGHLADDGLTFTNNSFHDLATDGIFGGGSSHVVVTGNQFTNFHPEAGAHPDAIQFWGATDGSHGDVVTVANNTITRGDGEPVQGIFVESTDDITITGNVLVGTMFNGIGISTSKNVLIQDNFVQGFSDMETRIIVRGESSNVTVDHNTAQSIVNLLENGQPNPGYVESANTLVAGATGGDLSALTLWQASHGVAGGLDASPGAAFAAANPVAPGVDSFVLTIPNLPPMVVEISFSMSMASGWVL